MRLLKPGKAVLNDWEIKEVIFESTDSVVYEILRNGYHIKSHAALKVTAILKLNSCLNDVYSPYESNAFKECVIMEKLKGCSNIVSYEDYAVIPHRDGKGWDVLMKTELLPSLFRYDSDIPFTAAILVQLGIDICRGLEVCQANGVFHRDISPLNIFVTHYGCFKLGDFGHACFASDTQARPLEIQNFMSPEACFEDGFYYCSDVYSLGLVLYYFLNGEAMPFWESSEPDEENAQTAFEKRMNGASLERPVNGSEKLWAAIKKACEYEPKNRFASARGFRNALEECMYEKSEDDCIDLLLRP